MNGNGYVLCVCECVNCHQQMICNPHHVPSIRLDGERRPVCRPCIDAANAKRVAVGLPPWPIHPDAYEPLPEGAL